MYGVREFIPSSARSFLCVIFWDLFFCEVVVLGLALEEVVLVGEEEGLSEDLVLVFLRSGEVVVVDEEEDLLVGEEGESMNNVGGITRSVCGGGNLRFDFRGGGPKSISVSRFFIIGVVGAVVSVAVGFLSIASVVPVVFAEVPSPE